MAAESKRLRKAKSRRTKAEKRLHKAVEAVKKNPKSKTAKKMRSAAKKALKKARTAVKHAATGKAPRKTSKKPKAAKKPRKAAAKKPKAAKRPKAKPRKAAAKKPKKAKKRNKSPQHYYRKALAAGTKHERQAAKLRAQYEAALKANKSRSAAQVEKLRKQQDKLKERLGYHERMAAEHRSRKHSRRGKRGRRRNPITGYGETIGAVLGVLVGGTSTVLGDRFVAGHALASTPAGTADAPANGDVYEVSAAALPLWSNFKMHGWKRIAVAVINVAAPLGAAHYVKHAGAKTFLQLWGFTSLGITGTKLTVDTLAKLLGGKNLGFRLMAPETVAQNQLAASKASGIAPTPMVVAPGATGKQLGYTPPALGLGKGGTGAGDCNCATPTDKAIRPNGRCMACNGKIVVPGGSPAPPATPPGASPGPAPLAQTGGASQGGTPRLLSNNTCTPSSVQGGTPGSVSMTGVANALEGVGGGKKNITSMVGRRPGSGRAASGNRKRWI